LRGFSQRSPFVVKIVQNQSRLGVIRNFEKAISLCTGELILLCDQDDVWKRDKIRRFYDIFAKYPGAEAIFSNASVVSSGLEPLSEDLWTSLGFHEPPGQIVNSSALLQRILGGNLVFGTTLGFRARARDFLLPIPLDLSRDVLHDAWIALTLACRGSLLGLNEQLSLYRQHSAQQTGIAKRSGPNWNIRLQRSGRERRAKLREAATSIDSIYKHLRQNKGLSEQQTRPVGHRLAHMQRRIGLPTSYAGRMKVVIPELFKGRYYKYSGSIIIAAVRDVVL
jgi:hypothetical protein